MIIYHISNPQLIQITIKSVLNSPAQVTGNMLRVYNVESTL